MNKTHHSKKLNSQSKKKPINPEWIAGLIVTAVGVLVKNWFRADLNQWIDSGEATIHEVLNLPKVVDYIGYGIGILGIVIIICMRLAIFMDEHELDKNKKPPCWDDYKYKLGIEKRPRRTPIIKRLITKAAEIRIDGKEFAQKHQKANYAR